MTATARENQEENSLSEEIEAAIAVDSLKLRREPIVPPPGHRVLNPPGL
jgi:hypothetical protein